MEKEYYKKYEPVYTPIAKTTKEKHIATADNSVSAVVNRFMKFANDGDLIILAVLFILCMEEDKDYITLIALALMLLS